MANEDNTNSLPGGKNFKRTAAEFLPAYFRTNTNKKFLQATIDQFVSDGVVEKIDAFVGKKEAKAVTISDNYLSEINADRSNYQFEPYAVYKDDLDNIEFSADYLDYLGLIKTFRGNTKNHSKLNEQEFYAWNPHIDFDKFTNFREYYWLPNGPEEVPVRGQSRNVVSTYSITTVTDDDNTALLFSPDGRTRNPNLTLYRGQTYRFEINTDGYPITIALDRKFIPTLENNDITIGVSDKSNVLNKILDKSITAWIEGINWSDLLITDNNVLNAKNSLSYEDFVDADFVKTLVETSIDQFKASWNSQISPYVNSVDFLAYQNKQFSTTAGNDTIIDNQTRYDRADYVADSFINSATVKVEKTNFVDIFDNLLLQYPNVSQNKTLESKIRKLAYSGAQIVLDSLNVNSPVKLFNFTERALNSFLQDQNDENISFVYTEGVKYFPQPIIGDTNEVNDFVNPGYIENGVIEFTIPNNAPNELYIVSQSNIDTSCRLKIYDIEENTEIDVENEIIGKKTYTTGDGWSLSNGMKVYFTGSVTPEKYSQGFYYVEGVGSSITLIPINELSVPAIFTQDTLVPFDSNGFDRVPFSNALSFAGTKDYIVINRSSPERNGWARYNRWFHKDVILKSAEINKQEKFAFDESARAKRPIIEFEAGLRLFDHGTKNKSLVDLVDDYTNDVFSTIEGKTAYNIDGIDLAENMRVLFTADPDPLVNGKIYIVKFIDHNNNKNIISLIEAEDANPETDETVLVRNGQKYAGRMFWYNGSEWKVAQDKNSINQFPKFDLFDTNGNSYGDLDIYPLNNFKGNEIFSYQVGEGVKDTELGFPLIYKNLVNSGDILFEFDLLKENYTYEVLGIVSTLKSDVAYLKKYDLSGENFVFENAWKKANEKSKQYVIRKYTGQEQVNSFPIDFFDNSAALKDLKVVVYKNNKLLQENIDFEFVNLNSTRFVVFENDIDFDDIVIIKGHSEANKNDNGYYETPHNFERNPLNNNILEFTYGQVNDHVEGLIVETPGFVGIQPGSNNLRDLGPVAQYGRKFVQHSGPINLPLINLAFPDSNIVNAIRYAKREYSKFKRDFVQIAETLGVDAPVKQHVDLIIEEYKKNKRESMPFFNSDMIGSGGSKRLEYTVLDADTKFYALSKPFNWNINNRSAVNVYINGAQICYNIDYVFTDEGFINVTKDIVEGDLIEIFEYETTQGCYIPPTPTKLGMYPAYKPQKFVDTTYNEPTNVIQGHDGSIIVAYDDYRDDLILELERRIYNNLKIEYDTSIFDVNDYVPGENRNTGITKEDIDKVLITDFVNWIRLAGNVDYTDNSFVQQFETFTYNYSNSVSSKQIKLPGFWRQVYIQAFDTDSPNLRPWEMLGFTIQPKWWEEVYGPAPYTKDNLILWKDLEKGLVREPNKQPVVRKKYIRPNLTKHIPVNESGRLISPLDSGYAKEFSYVTSRNKQFAFGDGAPAETAWRRSSEYPFALITALLINRPAAITGLLYDRSRIIRDNIGNLVYKDTLKRINTKDLVFPATQINNEVIYTAGLVNYIQSFMQSNITTNYNFYMSSVSKLSNQLGFKLGGFAEKNKLRLVLDSRTPTNKGNVFVPFENYNIFLKKSSPLEIISYSGVIIEKIGRGFRVSGYDLEDPFFNIFTPNISANDPAVTVGGISESFIEWDEGKIFDRGRIVQYQNNYYRVNETHQSSDTFDENKFSRLAVLPVVGGATAEFRRNFSNNLQQINYGTTFSTIQEVVDFLFGYDAFLKSQGFTFNYWNPRTEAVESFDLLIKEFMFFTTENWASGTVLTISPAANQLIFEKDFFTVDNIYDNFLGYNIKQIDGNTLKFEFTNIARASGNSFSLFPINTTEGIYYSKFSLVQKEHVVLIDNKTVFNDTIYDPEPGYRQERIKVVGYRTDEWDGSLNIPGFIYDQAKFTIWEPWQKYNIADVVKYKEYYYSAKNEISGSAEFDADEWVRLEDRPVESVKPNFDYRTKQFNDFYDLDTDNFDSEQQRLAQHLIGYQKRDYLSNIITDDVSQYKFYQGFIQDKGTLNSLTKLFDKLGSADKDSLEFYEEWAFRTAQYGAVDAFKEVEYQLDESKFRLEPQLVELVDTVDQKRTDLVFQYPIKDVFVKEPGYNHRPFPTKWSSEQFTKTGGYVSLDQIDFISKTLEDILNLDINQVVIGSIIWVPQYKNTWNIFEAINPGYFINRIERTDTGFIAVFNRNVPFVVGDIIGLTNITDELNGFRLVRNVTQNRVEFFTTTPISEDVTDISDSTLGSVVQLLSKRVDDIDSMNSVIQTYGLTPNSKFWVDNYDSGKYAVFQNNEIFVGSHNLVNRENGKTFYGADIATNGNNTTLIISDVDNKVYNYRRLSSVQSYTGPLQEITPQASLYNTNAGFGRAVELTKDGNWLVIGAPNASNVKSKFKGEIQQTNYLFGDIVSDGGLFFEAQTEINFDSSTITTQSQDWKQVNVLEANENGSGSGLTDQGVIHIFKKQKDGNFAIYQTILSPYPQDNEKFGIAIESSFDPLTLNTRIYVRSEKNNGRIYFLDLPSINDTFGYSRDLSYRGKFDSAVKYIKGEIVEYNAELYTAIQTVPAGNNFNPLMWEKTSKDIDRLGYIPIIESENIIDMGDSTVFDNNIRIADNFAVSQTGDVLILTGYNTAQTEYQLVIYRKSAGDRYELHQTINPPVNEIEFGHSIDISEDGKFIAVGAIFADDKGSDTGKVYIYTYNTNTLQFELSQELLTPSPAKNERFGWQVEFSKNKLAVVGINGENNFYTTFDEEQTTLDSKATTIVDTLKNQCELYIYENINNKFTYAENVEYQYLYTNQNGDSVRALLNDAIEPKILFSNNHLHLALPNVSLDDTGNKHGIVFDLVATQEKNSWDLLSVAKDFVEYEKLKGVFLYDKVTSDLITYLDIIDPIQGKIANIAEQELTYKLYYDPAIFNTGSSVTGFKNPWTNNHVGELWWDLSTVKWFDPYQGNIIKQNNKWNRVIPSFEVDVYEWVESDYLPSEWDNLSDSTAGISEGISGLSKYGDARYSIAQTYDPITGRFKQKYYFWVRNKKTIPNKPFRNTSCENVINLIKDPSGSGYRFITIFNEKEFAIHNCRSLIKGKDTIVHFDYANETLNLRNVHSQYKLLTEGEATSEPNDILVEKWIDSLVGYDEKNNKLPDLTVSASRRYGILNEPLQTMFVNKTEALKQIVERINGVLEKNLIVDDFDISPLNSKDPLPTDVSGMYDEKIDNEGLLRFVGTAKTQQAKLSLQIVDGRIIGATIENPGRGYKDPAYNPNVDLVRRGPLVEIIGSGSGAEIKTEINNLGQIVKVNVVNQGRGYTNDTVAVVRRFSVLVENDSTIGGFWAIYNWNTQDKEWFRTTIQDYDTTFYWQYKDWYADGYNSTTPINHLVAASYQLDGLNDNIGDVVKIENIGTGGWLLLKKIDNLEEVDYTVNYKTIGRERGTIQISKLLYNNRDSGFDNQIYDSVLYDREPINETRIILKTIRSNIFVDQLKVEWNKLFFSSIRYILSEQPNVDWVFKSSFIRAKHNVGELDQRITFRNDNLENYQDYVAEVKPYSSKIREYISSYEKLEPTQTSVTDFDLPPRYSDAQKRIVAESIKISNNVIGPINRFIETYPQKHWLDNVGYEIKEIIVHAGGTNWRDTPLVTITGGGGPTLEGRAIIARGSVVDIDINTDGALYTSAPTIIFNGTQDEDSTPAKATAILGNSKVRSTHMIVKFDRTYGKDINSTLYDNIDRTETFVANAGIDNYILEWPLDLAVSNINVTVNNIESLSSEYTVYNQVDTSLGFTRYKGVIQFTNSLTTGSTIKVSYKIAANLLHAADRIRYHYNPTTGMLGRDLSQLMDGVDFSGVQIDTISLTGNQGFETSEFGVGQFDTFDTSFDDIKFVADGSTEIIELESPLEAGVIYTVYKNNIRLDDENYDETQPPTNQIGVQNPNAVIRSIVGDGIQNTINLAGYQPPIETLEGDIIYIRKIDSDGSFTPGDAAFDTQLTGGDLSTLNNAFLTATGKSAGEIVVDGDGFISIANRGPEELVPGTVLDTLDIQVYNAVESGQGVITIQNFLTDGSTTSWELEQFPQYNGSIIVKINNVILDNTSYEVDYKTKTLSITDSSAITPNQVLSILTIGNNGNNILDSDKFIGDGKTTEFETAITYTTPISGFITINGVVTENYNLIQSTNNRVTIDFGGAPAKDDVITYTIYQGDTQQYSQIIVDKTFDITNNNKIHEFAEIGFPFNEKPVADKILVKKGDRFLKSHYNIEYQVTTDRQYEIQAWAIDDVDSVRKEDIILYLNGEVLSRNFWTYDPINYRVILLQYNKGVPGDKLQIYVIKNSEYTFITTKITVASQENINGPLYQFDNKTFVNFEFADSSTVSGFIVDKKIGQNNKEAIITMQGYVRDFINHYPSVNSVAIDEISNSNPAVVTTLTNHNMTDGDKVIIENVEGMTILNEKTYFVKVSSNKTLEIYSDADLTVTVDSTNYTPYSAFGVISTLAENDVVVTSYVNNNLVSFNGSIQNIEFINSDVLSLTEPSSEPIEIYVFSNHDINDFNRISFDMVYASNRLPVENQNYIDRNLLSRGYIRLNQPAINDQYTWVILNGELLTPGVDYKLVNNKTALQLNTILNDKDSVEILQFGAPLSEPKFAFRQFKDILNRTHYKRINEQKSYFLARDLNYYDQFIELTDTTNIDEPSPDRSRNIPGVIWVNGERIEYMIKEGNTLRQLRRGTLGTSINNFLPVGSKIYSQGIGETIQYVDETRTQIQIGDGSTKDFELDFDLWNHALAYYSKFESIFRDPTKTLDEILAEIAANFIEVFVAGRRLRKTELRVYDHTIAQDSPAADVVLPPEFTISSNNILTLANTPANLQKIQIVRKSGKVWNDPNTPLGQSNNSIAKFLTGATIKLTR